MNWTEDELSEYLKKRGQTPLNAPKTRSKYGNRKVWADGFCFDSEKERDYYNTLKLLLRAGVIKGFGRQPEFLLTEGTGPHDRGTSYRADFIVWYMDRVEIVDTKGFETETFKLKLKMMKEKYPEIEVKIV